MNETFKEKHAEWVKKNRVTIGDSVRVTRRAEDHENGWPYFWAESPMTSAVGKVGTVTEISDDCIQLSIPGIQSDYLYPYFVLEKVDSEQQASAHKEWEVSYGLKAETGDPVLVRDCDDEEWRYSLLSHVDRAKNPHQYFTVGMRWAHCIPYAGNEHLVGTSKAWKDPDAEAEKNEFRFGAKVRGGEGDGAWEGMILDYDERDNSYQIACRNSEEKDTDIFWADADEFTYID